MLVGWFRDAKAIIAVDFGHDRVAIEPRSHYDREILPRNICAVRSRSGKWWSRSSPIKPADARSSSVQCRSNRPDASIKWEEDRVHPGLLIAMITMLFRCPFDEDLTVPRVSTYRRDEKTIADHRDRVMKIVRSCAVHGEKEIAAYCVRPMEIVWLSRWWR